jgi:NAD(P)H-hydrate epimerase
VDGYSAAQVRAAEAPHLAAGEPLMARAAAAGVRLVDRDDQAGVDRALRSASVIVDGLLGTGTSPAPALRGAARDPVVAAMRIVDELGIRVVAVDLPSGIDPDDGSVPDPTVLTADVTVTFGAVKAGLLVEPGASCAGRVELVDLGLGPELAAMTPLVRTDRT